MSQELRKRSITLQIESTALKGEIMSESIYHITFKIKTNNGFEDPYEKNFAFNFLPRVGDVILIDGYHNKILCIDYDYKNHLALNVYVDNVGDHTEYSEKYLTSLYS